MGEYIGRIYEEVKGRPHYVVKEVSSEELSQSEVGSAMWHKGIHVRRDTE